MHRQPLIQERVDNITLDFAIVVQKIPPTTEESMRRTVRMPPTIPCPAVLLGFRSDWMDDDGSVITSHDRDALSEAMTPYIKTVTDHLNLLSLAHDSNNKRSTLHILFCTYLKAGHLHIIACPPQAGAHVDTPPRLILVDSIPIVMQNRSVDDYLNRMRLVMALFTLQKHIVLFSEHWDNTVWPRDVIHKECSELVNRLGMITPTPIAHYDPDDTAWYDDNPGKSLSDYLYLGDSDDGEEEETDQQEATANAEEREISLWESLKMLYERYKEWGSLEGMSRTEAWVEEYDPRNLELKGPVP